jgi:hypothetical protein
MITERAAEATVRALGRAIGFLVEKLVARSMKAA